MSILLFCLFVSISTRKKEGPHAVVYTLRRSLASIIKSNLRGGGGEGCYKPQPPPHLRGSLWNPTLYTKCFSFPFCVPKANFFLEELFCSETFSVVKAPSVFCPVKPIYPEIEGWFSFFKTKVSSKVFLLWNRTF